MKRITATLNQRRVQVIVIPVRGVDNVADCPSRDRPVTEERRLATWKQMKMYHEGWVKMRCVKTKCPSNEGVRHCEDDVELDSLAGLAISACGAEPESGICSLVDSYEE